MNRFMLRYSMPIILLQCILITLYITRADKYRGYFSFYRIIDKPEDVDFVAADPRFSRTTANYIIVGIKSYTYTHSHVHTDRVAHRTVS